MTDKEAIRFLTIEKEATVASKDSVNSENTDYFEKHEEAYIIAIKAIDENAKLKEAIGKIKEELKEYRYASFIGRRMPAITAIMALIDKHTEGLV